VNAPVRLALFGIVAAVVFSGGAALGAAAGPAPTNEPNGHNDHEEPAMTDYRIDAATTTLEPEAEQTLQFRIVDGRGEPVTRFDVQHERPMHLIVVSNDLTQYAHVHPSLGDGGQWTVELPPLPSGAYRAIADTMPSGGADLNLPLDLVVDGPAAVRAIPEPAAVAEVGGLEVELDLEPNEHGLGAALTVRRDGKVVDPDPYLGARGHLVAISAGDLRYLHVHPDDETATRPVSFNIAEPKAGRYRLFFDFSVDGKVRTAAFTVDVKEVALSHGAHS
jgi:hypothetical protein